MHTYIQYARYGQNIQHLCSAKEARNVCMYVSMHACMYSVQHMCSAKEARNVCMYACMHVCILCSICAAPKKLGIYVSMYACMHACIVLCIYRYRNLCFVCVCVCVYACVRMLYLYNTCTSCARVMKIKILNIVSFFTLIKEIS
jgi:hypothetical protein